MRALGARVERTGEGEWRVRGVGVGGFAQPDAPLDFGNSGTGCRLVMGAVAGCPIAATFDGDASLRKRPMQRMLDPLALMGARPVACQRRRAAAADAAGRARSDADRLPHAGAVGADQVGGAARRPGGAGRHHRDRERGEPRPHRAAARAFRRRGRGRRRTASTAAGSRSRASPSSVPAPVVVPADPSSAAFPMVAALIVPGSDVILTDVMTNPLRTGLITTLREMGADIEALNVRSDGGEEMADLRVRASALHGRRGAGRARAVDDRRISDPGGGGGLRRRHDAHARPEGAARQGIRSPRRRRRRAAGPTASRSRSRATT